MTVHALPITNVSTFQEYADNVFIPHLERQLRDTQRVDVVWDEYWPDNLNEGTRDKRIKGVRRTVSSCQATGMTYSVIQSTRRDSLNPCHQKLRIASSLLNVRYISQLESMLHVLEHRSKCPVAIRKKQTVRFWYT